MGLHEHCSRVDGYKTALSSFLLPTLRQLILSPFTCTSASVCKSQNYKKKNQNTQTTPEQKNPKPTNATFENATYTYKELDTILL